MYSELKNYLCRLQAEGEKAIRYRPDDIRLSIAVLYYRVILIDGRVRIEETERFRQILAESLDVVEDELILFEKMVLELAMEQTSLQRLLASVCRMPEEKRRQILLHMKQISVSDRELHEFEINLVARTAELIGLPEESWPEEQPPDGRADDRNGLLGMPPPKKRGN